MKRIAMCALVFGVLLGAAGWTPAEEAGSKSAPALSTAGSIRDALLMIEPAHTVELTLTNGKSYTGQLGPVGNHTVLLTKLAGKDFYDALIRIDDIAAVEMRVRGN